MDSSHTGRLFLICILCLSSITGAEAHASLTSSPVVVSIVFAVTCYTAVFIGLILFLRNRRKFPINAREPWLVAVSTVMITFWTLMVVIRICMGDDFPCLASLWGDFIGVGVTILVYLVRVWRLYYKFEITHERLVHKGLQIHYRNSTTVTTSTIVSPTTVSTAPESPRNRLSLQLQSPPTASRISNPTPDSPPTPSTSSAPATPTPATAAKAMASIAEEKEEPQHGGAKASSGSAATSPVAAAHSPAVVVVVPPADRDMLPAPRGREVDMAARSWFLAHRRYATAPYVAPFCVAVLALCIVFPLISTLGDEKSHGYQVGAFCETGIIGSLLFPLWVILWVVPFLYLAHKMRELNDGFLLKMELKFTAIWTVVLAILWAVFKLGLKTINTEVFPFSSLITYVIYMGVCGLAVFVPLHASYKFEKLHNAQRANRSSDAGVDDVGVSPKDFRLDGKLEFETVLASDEGYSSFKAFLASEFSVENILFWSDINEFRKKSLLIEKLLHDAEARERLVAEQKAIEAQRAKLEHDAIVGAFGEITREGWAQKQGQQVKSWKRRYFVLTPFCLYYFKDVSHIRDGPERSLGMIYLFGDSAVDSAGVPATRDEFMFHVSSHAGERVFHVLCASEEERGAWMRSLQLTIGALPKYDKRVHTHVKRRSDGGGGGGGSISVGGSVSMKRDSLTSSGGGSVSISVGPSATSLSTPGSKGAHLQRLNLSGNTGGNGGTTNSVSSLSPTAGSGTGANGGAGSPRFDFAAVVNQASADALASPSPSSPPLSAEARFEQGNSLSEPLLASSSSPPPPSSSSGNGSGTGTGTGSAAVSGSAAKDIVLELQPLPATITAPVSPTSPVSSPPLFDKKNSLANKNSKIDTKSLFKLLKVDVNKKHRNVQQLKADLYGLALWVYNKYVSNTAPLEVNLPDKVVYPLHHLFSPTTAAHFEGKHQVDPAAEKEAVSSVLYDKAQHVIFQLMGLDSYLRYTQTPAYQTLVTMLREQKLKHEVMVEEQLTST